MNNMTIKKKNKYFKLFLITIASVLILMLLKEILYIYLFNASNNFIYFFIYNKTDSDINVIIKNGKNTDEINIIKRICKVHKNRINKKNNSYNIIFNIDHNIYENNINYPSEYIRSYSAYGGMEITIVVEKIENINDIKYISIYDDFDYESQGLAHHIKMDFFDYIYKDNKGRIKINFYDYYWEIIRDNAHLHKRID